MSALDCYNMQQYENRISSSLKTLDEILSAQETIPLEFLILKI